MAIGRKKRGKSHRKPNGAGKYHAPALEGLSLEREENDLQSYG